ncbi:hypothetical protein [Apilactobacillus timberlakei]|uniref:hypothetical protein n=1 Tax=Apilactobacillus timberlakei TaxID=2008380 RepID=UPI00112A1EA5|nr:hypothetical protein [Apilactobacillus timberlakei]TPR16732.1 hypothetical protein DYZ95_07060 [Apilactobacillus timberlakei]TPR21495.1 hypothetical protein DY083_05610 [Apilactobacillus timberlakei]
MVSSNYKPIYDLDEIHSFLDKIGYPNDNLDSTIVNMKNANSKQLKIDNDTYNRLKKIKQDHNVFTKDIVGMSVLIMYDLLYKNKLKISDKKIQELDED